MTRLTYHLVAILLFVLAASALAQSGRAAMTNDDVEQMLSQGLTEDVVVEAILANEVGFDVSPSGLLALKKAKVSDRVVQAMLAAESKKREAATHRITAATAQHSANSGLQRGFTASDTGMPMPNAQGLTGELQLPRVALFVNDQRQPMDPSETEIATGQGKGGSVAGSVLKGFGKTVLMAGNMTGVPVPHGGRSGPGMPNVGRTWALPGRNSDLTIRSSYPKFNVEFGDIPGVDPDSYEPILLRLIQTKDNWRLVSTSKDKFDRHGNDTRIDKIKPEEKVAITIKSMGRGHLIVAAAAQLPAGEYGLILHPKKSQKEYAGIANANADAIFYSAWDFSLNAVNH